VRLTSVNDTLGVYYFFQIPEGKHKVSLIYKGGKSSRTINVNKDTTLSMQFLKYSITLSVVDDVVYKTGFFSVGGGSWQSFTLQGVAYGGGSDWLSGSAVASLPFFGVGEHYVIVFSCSRVGSSWDCHSSQGHPGGFWQLLVVK